MKIGTRVAMSDGWKGVVTAIRSGTVIAQKDGVPIQDHRGCRAFPRSAMTNVTRIGSGRVAVKWDPEGERRAHAAAKAARRKEDKEQRERESLARSWDAVSALH